MDYDVDSDDEWEDEPEGEDLGDDAMVRGAGGAGGGVTGLRGWHTMLSKRGLDEG